MAVRTSRILDPLLKEEGLTKKIDSFLFPSLEEYRGKIEAFKTASKEFNILAEIDVFDSLGNNIALRSNNNNAESSQRSDPEKRKKWIIACGNLYRYWENCRAMKNKDTQYDIQYLFIEYYSPEYIHFLFFENSEKKLLDNLLDDIQTLIGRIDRKEPLGEDIIRPFIFEEIICNYFNNIKYIFGEHLRNPPTYGDSISREREYGDNYYDWHRFKKEIMQEILIEKQDNFSKIAGRLTRAKNIFETFSKQAFSESSWACANLFDSCFSEEKKSLKKILSEIKNQLNGLINLLQIIATKLKITLDIPPKITDEDEYVF